MECGSNNSLFGKKEGTIKYLGSDLVAIEGSNIMERMLLNDIRVPYTELLKGRIILKPNQADYLMDHLGLGEKVTFVSIIVRYDPKSKLEEDNFMFYSYVTTPLVKAPIGKILTLNGNSSHRIPQLLLTNPSTIYPIQIDVLIANVKEFKFSTIGPVITFTSDVFLVSSDGMGLIVGIPNIIEPSKVPNTNNGNKFYYEVGYIQAQTLNLYDLIESVVDDVDGIINKLSVNFQGISTNQSYMANVQVVDTTYNITEVSLYVNIANIDGTFSRDYNTIFN